MSTRQFLRKNILQLFLLPENSSYTEEEGMLDLPIKKNRHWISVWNNVFAMATLQCFSILFNKNFERFMYQYTT